MLSMAESTERKGRTLSLYLYRREIESGISFFFMVFWLVRGLDSQWSLKVGENAHLTDGHVSACDTFATNIIVISSIIFGCYLKLNRGTLTFLISGDFYDNTDYLVYISCLTSLSRIARPTAAHATETLGSKSIATYCRARTKDTSTTNFTMYMRQTGHSLRAAQHDLSKIQRSIAVSSREFSSSIQRQEDDGQ